jgi:hypothetical protein
MDLPKTRVPLGFWHQDAELELGIPGDGPGIFIRYSGLPLPRELTGVTDKCPFRN